MSSKAHAERFSRTLSSTNLCEPVNANFGEDRVAILCRVKQEKEKQWVDTLQKILVAAEEEANEVHTWKCHFCKHYFLKDGKMVWGWNVSIQSREMSHSLDAITKVVRGEPLRAVRGGEVEEFPLFGAPADRNAPRGGKGVHTIGGSRSAEFQHPGKK